MEIFGYICISLVVVAGIVLLGFDMYDAFYEGKPNKSKAAFFDFLVELNKREEK